MQQGREVMSHVHGDRIDRSRRVVRPWWWGLGILSLARLTARAFFTSVPTPNRLGRGGRGGGDFGYSRWGTGGGLGGVRDGPAHRGGLVPGRRLALTCFGIANRGNGVGP